MECERSNKSKGGEQSDKPSVDMEEIARTFTDGDMSFTEDRHRELMTERAEKAKVSGFGRWLRGFLGFGESKAFNPPLPSDDELVRSGLACEKEALQLLESADWRREKTGPCVGDLVESLRHPKYGKMFRLTGIVDCPVEFLFKEMTEGLERMSEWNPTILECKIVKQVDPSTSLTYQVTTGGPQNVVKPRDFVNVRRVSRVGGRLLSSAVSVEYPTLPPLDTYIRGHNHVGCWSIEAKQDEGREKVLFQWLMACDLKGWLPQYVLDTAFSTAQLDFLRHLRDFAAQCRVDGSF